VGVDVYEELEARNPDSMLKLLGSVLKIKKLTSSS
jgi:hypothetical protein